MKTKFKVDILKRGGENDAILRMIASHNEGKVPLDKMDFIFYAQLRKAHYPILFLDKFQITFDDECTLKISEDGGESYTLIITEVELHELKEMEDDLKEILNN